MATTLTTPNIAEPEQHLVLSGIGWGQYVTISDALPDGGGLRMIYFDRRLTFLVTSRRHDWFSECMGDLVKAVADGCGVDWEVAGRSTFRLEDLGAGVEGDSTFYFGENAERMHGPRNIDLSSQPPPDLAIEVEVTHSANDAVAAWGRLGVPEVWRLDAERWTLEFGLRREDGTYAANLRSAAFPLLEPADVLGQLRQAEEIVSSRWRRQLNAWVRDVLLPRRGG